MIEEKVYLSALPAGEAMVDARQASFALSLPYYWFSDRAMRAAKRVPHYLLGGLVRFRMSELEQWMKLSSAAKPRVEWQ